MHLYNMAGNMECVYVCVSREITMIGCVTISVASCEAAPLSCLSAFRDKTNTHSHVYSMYTQFKV